MKKCATGIFLLLINLFCCSPPNRDFAVVPEWAKKSVWYQIFPERFRNGDPSNDPTLADTRGAWPHDTKPEWQISPWTADWYRLQPWEQGNGRGFYYNVQRRRYGGDLAGVLEKLDHLEELGINAIYFNPVFESPSLHKYDAAYYHHIDDNFGPDPAGDKKIIAMENAGDPSTWQWTGADRLFLTLLHECHQRGIRVIIDGVFNHVGLNFWAFQEVRKNGKNSKYLDWFTIKRLDDPTTPEDEFDYECWNGARELPEFREDENGLVQGVAAHIQAVVQRWMDPNGDGNPSDGIDGWRLDVAEKVSPVFWQKFRRWVRTINPEAFLVGEIWWEDWHNNKMFNAAPWLQGDQFDAVMNYRFAEAVTHAFIDRKNQISISALNDKLSQVRSEYPLESQWVLLNLMDSHDVDRLASNIVNPDYVYDHQVSYKDDKNYIVRKPTENERQIQKLIAVLQMTYIGAPMLYYGTEVGMWGGDDPDCRKPMIWNDLSFEDETAMPDGSSRKPDKVLFDSTLFEYYKKLIQVRKSSNALTQGDFQTISIDDEKKIFVYKRQYRTETAIVILNLSGNVQTISIECQDFDTWHDALHEEIIYALMGDLMVTIPGKEAKILFPRVTE